MKKFTALVIALALLATMTAFGASAEGTYAQAPMFDALVESGVIQEEVILQTGYSTYEPKHCTWSRLLPYQQMQSYIRDARIVITHGGPASFIAPLQVGKVPIVVPRKKELGEHVNDHQVEFARAVAERMGTILVAEDMDTLEDLIVNYDACAASRASGMGSNNAAFCAAFERLARQLVEK